MGRLRSFWRGINRVTGGLDWYGALGSGLMAYWILLLDTHSAF